MKTRAHFRIMSDSKQHLQLSRKATSRLYLEALGWALRSCI